MDTVETGIPIRPSQSGPAMSLRGRSERIAERSGRRGWQDSVAMSTHQPLVIVEAGMRTTAHTLWVAEIVVHEPRVGRRDHGVIAPIAPLTIAPVAVAP